MPTSPEAADKQSSPKASPSKAVNKATIAKAFDSKSSTIKDRVRQWQEQGGGVKAAPEVFIDTCDEDKTEHTRSGSQAASKDGKPTSEERKFEGITTAETDLGERHSGVRRKEQQTETSDTGLDDAKAHGQVKTKRPNASTKKRDISATQLRIAQAILGPTVRPSERLRRLSEAKKDAPVIAPEKPTKLAKSPAKGTQKEMQDTSLAASLSITTATSIDASVEDTVVSASGSNGTRNTQEAGTPKRRIISDGHWKTKRTPPKESHAAQPPPKPTVEGWLDSVPAVGRNIALDDGIRAMPGPDAEVRRERNQRQEERRNRRRERAEARKSSALDSSADNSSELPVGEDQRGSEGGRTRSKLALKASALSQIRGSGDGKTTSSYADHQRTQSAPNSLAPSAQDFTGLSDHDDRTESRSIPPSHLSYSSQDDSDNLTSISRRRPPHSTVSKSKRGLLGHATKLFTKHEPGLGSRLEAKQRSYSACPKTPNIESWLNNSADQHLKETPAGSADIAEPLCVKTRSGDPFDRAPARSTLNHACNKTLSENRGTQDDASSTSGPDFGPVDLDRTRKTRRVLRHRDGTTTSEDVEDSLNKALEPSSSQRQQAQNQRPLQEAKDSLISRGHFSRGHIPLDPVSNLGPKDSVSTEVDGDIPDDLSSVGRTRRPLQKSRKNDSGLPTSDVQSSKRSSNAYSRQSLLSPRAQANGHEVPQSMSREYRALVSRSHRRRLAKHSDLISVLSSPHTSGGSIRSAGSIRTYRSKIESATIDVVLNEFVSDETKYSRELYTLVDGVIPVLLSNSLSSNNPLRDPDFCGAAVSSATAHNMAKPIFDMGIALEKLKTYHEKAVSQHLHEFIVWALGAVRFYKEYLRTWRAGFQDVVVNLAPKESPSAEKNGDKGLPRNMEGDVIDDNGERVDVAFLLKRPLIRLKYLAKTMDRLDRIDSTERSRELVQVYKDLVEQARKRSTQERSRLEDEAASGIDATKARDPRTLEPVEGVTIAPNRHVKARDTFELELIHSSGQRLGCTAELYLRDDSTEKGNTGDLLVAEVDGNGKWLLFPPLHFDQLSARHGEEDGEIVVMIRGAGSDANEWSELMFLSSEEENVAPDWIALLGSQPMPPPVSLKPSFEGSYVTESQNSSALQSSDDGLSHSLAHIHVPIGECASGAVKRWKDASEPRFRKRHSHYSPSTIMEETTSNLDQSCSTHNVSAPAQNDATTSARGDRLPRNLTEAMKAAESPHLGLKRARAQRKSRTDDEMVDSCNEALCDAVGRTGVGSVPTSPVRQESHAELADPQSPSSKQKPRTPARYRKEYMGLTKSSSPTTTSFGARNLPITSAQQPGTLMSNSKKAQNPEFADVYLNKPSIPANFPARDPQGASANSRRVKSDFSNQHASNAGRTHRRTSSPLKHEYEPVADVISAEESDASTVVHDLSSLSESSSSDSELEDGDDAHSIIVPLSAIGRYRKAPRTTPPESLADNTLSPSQSASQAPYRDVPAQPGQSRKAVASLFYWSDEGSWQSLSSQECTIAITPGLIEAYERHGLPDDRRPTVSTSRPASRKTSGWITDQLLLGLELTPLVPIRRGTALDISIRSPPTSDSKVAVGGNSNFLLRSRTPEECEVLYALINHSRIHNPTYIALQNARATSYNPQFHGTDRGDNSRLGKASSWFGLRGRKKSYRAASSPAPSISKQTDSSLGSMGSAFSALRNFSRGTGRFNISRSTVTSRQGSGSNSLFTSSEGTGSSGVSTPSLFHGQPSDRSLGLTNCKIRFYLRETTTKWADLGPASLTIMRPDAVENSPGSRVPAVIEAAISIPMEHAGPENRAGHGVGMQATGGYASLGNKVSTSDKRIVILGDPKQGASAKESAWQTLLDVTLGETCFERVARTGIAVSVWENFEGGMVAKQGGVNAGRVRVYMMQFKNEADTAYTYSIVGRLRY